MERKVGLKAKVFLGVFLCVQWLLFLYSIYVCQIVFRIPSGKHLTDTPLLLCSVKELGSRN